MKAVFTKAAGKRKRIEIPRAVHIGKEYPVQAAGAVLFERKGEIVWFCFVHIVRFVY